MNGLREHWDTNILGLLSLFGGKGDRDQVEWIERERSPNAWRWCRALPTNSR